MCHFTGALLILLRDRPDGGVTSHGELCTGNDMFDTHQRCHSWIPYSSADLLKAADQLCGGKLDFRLHHTYGVDGLDAYRAAVDALPDARRALRPVMIDAGELYWNLNTAVTVEGIIKPFRARRRGEPPARAGLAAAQGAAVEQAGAYVRSQGPEAVQRYNKEVAEAFEELSPGEMVDGAAGVLVLYNVTDRAASFDGTHFTHQVNMEKVRA